MAGKLYQLSQLEELAGGDDVFVRSMVETFLEHTPGQLEEMLESYQKGDLSNVGKIAHKIKPNMDLFGISDLTDTIREVEKMGKAGDNDPSLKEKVAQVEQVLKEVFVQLKEY